MPKIYPKKLASARLYKITHAKEIKVYQDAYNAGRREVSKAWNKAKYDADPEAARARALAYHYANREKVLARKRAYRAKNRERLLALNRQYHVEHAEQRRARTRAYKAAHPEQYLSYESARRAKKMTPIAEKVSLSVLYLRDNKTCTICYTSVKRGEGSIDHIIPLSKGGEHTYRNCALAHKLCNTRKRDGIVAQQMHLF